MPAPVDAAPGGPEGADHTVHVVRDPGFAGYDFGPHHPMHPLRIDLTHRLCEALGIYDRDPIRLRPASAPATCEELLRVHTPALLEAVTRAGHVRGHHDLARGIGSDDTPGFPDMHEVSALVTGGTLDAVRAVRDGAARHAVNVAGGLHHAMPGAVSGFCVYNDAAVGIADLLASGVERVAYVDLDVHHGDGVERAFWDDPRVLTVSVHQSGTTLFPGTGFPGDTGAPGAVGSAVNVALPPGTGDAGWLRAVDAVVPDVLRAFGPQVIISQQGCDTHIDDPLAHLAVTVDAMRTAYGWVHDLAHELAEGRWVALGGGGYEVIDVVPRAWAHLTAVAAHHPVPLDTAVPSGWSEYVQAVVGRHGPRRMGDVVSVAQEEGRAFRPWSDGVDPSDPVDTAVMATRRAVFPDLGLDVW